MHVHPDMHIHMHTQNMCQTRIPCCKPARILNTRNSFYTLLKVNTEIDDQILEDLKQVITKSLTGVFRCCPWER